MTDREHDRSADRPRARSADHDPAAPAAGASAAGASPADTVDAPFFARGWAAASPLLERVGLAGARSRLVAGLRGTVVEVGAGTGVTFGHYPPGVTRVVAVEPDPHLRAHAERAAARAPVPVEVVDGVAETLPLAEGHADAVVFGLVLCTVPDVPGALAEAGRVLAPDGELRLLEHVRPAGVPGRVADRIAPLWGHLGGGCRPNQDTEGLVAAAGFDVTGLRTDPIPPLIRLVPVLSGAAPRASADAPRG